MSLSLITGLKMETNKIEEILETKGEYVTVSKGRSMFPMLRSGRDTVIIRKPFRKLKKYDVALYIRKEDGAYILHRIIGENSDGYIIRGDNCKDREYGIGKEDIIGVLAEFYRGGLHIKCDGMVFSLYSKIAVFLHPLQMWVKKFKKI